MIDGDITQVIATPVHLKAYAGTDRRAHARKALHIATFRAEDGSSFKSFVSDIDGLHKVGINTKSVLTLEEFMPDSDGPGILPWVKAIYPAQVGKI